MNRSILFFALLFTGIVLLTACGSDSNKITEGIEPTNDNSDIYEQGRSISQEMQGILLANVSGAIQVGGPSHAVSFCNTRAHSLTDSISKKYKVQISRISDKNRNVLNAANQSETALIDVMKKNGLQDTVMTSQGVTTYYSTIKTGMPACLKCHGSPENEIEPTTLSKIDSLYPNDKAKNYRMGDFRGLWKIQFQQ